MRANAGTRSRFLSAWGAATLAGSGIALGADTYTLRLSLSTSPPAIANAAVTELAQAVRRRSDGRLLVEIYPNGQLAKERDSIDGLASGSVDLVLEASVFLEPLFPRFQVLTLPFLFKDSATALRVCDGPIGDELFSDLDAKGIVGLIWTSTGFRELETVAKPVRVPDDMKGLRFRIQGGAVNVAMAGALGAIPVTIDFSEIYPALSQHTVDAIDSTLEGIVSNKFYLLVKYLAMTHHVPTLSPLIASKRKIEALPPDLQRILRDEARALRAPWRAKVNGEIAGRLKVLHDNGMTFTEIDRPAFRKAMDPVYAMLQSKLGGDIVQRVSRAAGAS